MSPCVSMTLHDYMDGKGITDAALAGKVGCDRSYITQIRNGRRRPSLAMALKLKKATGLPVETFMAGRTIQ